MKMRKFLIFKNAQFGKNEEEDQRFFLGCESTPKKSSRDDLSHLGDLESSQRPHVQTPIIFSFVIVRS